MRMGGGVWRVGELTTDSLIEMCYSDQKLYKHFQAFEIFRLQNV